MENDASSLLISNQLIKASAGSGKTYCLSVRFIRLLALGVAPESIVALTFTRKAAGEFFSRIADHISTSAGADAYATEFGKLNEIPDWNAENALLVLKDMVWSMPTLNLGTLDQFFYRILSHFCFEFQLPNGFQVVDPQDLEREINRLLGIVLGPRATKESVRQFLETLKESTYGNESSTYSQTIKNIVSTYHSQILECQEELRWGQPDVIWNGSSHPVYIPKDSESNIDSFRGLLETKNISEKKWDRWEILFDHIRNHQPGHEVPEVFKRFLVNVNELKQEIDRHGKGVLRFLSSPGIPFDSAREFQLLCDAIQPIIGAEWLTRMRRTKGLFFLLQQYETLYDDQLRRKGLITFSDILYLLNPVSDSDPSAMRPMVDKRHVMDFRLDTRFDHWLLDEFQDTSLPQWKILENLVDEVVQDPEGQRSLFVVGDIKQSIYGWRGGDYRLFEKLETRYLSHSSDSFSIDTLEKSYRSAPEIVDFINKVFSAQDSIQPHLGEQIARQWDWQDHISAQTDLQGHVAILSPENTDGNFSRSYSISDTYLAAIHDVIRSTKPIERELTCAILVRRNQDGDVVTRYLRSQGLPVSQTMDVPIAHDNLFVPAILSLIQWLIHPEDTYAWNHIRMTPLVTLSFLSDLDSNGPVFQMQKIRVLSLSGWLESIVDIWLEEVGSMDPFHSKRAHQLVEAARQFEKLSHGSLDDFLDYMENYRVQEAGSNKEIQVLTIHKAKGLGFDVVILPQLNVPFHPRQGDRHIVKRNESGEIDWITQVPSKNIVQLDTTLSQLAEENIDREIFESLCLFYVACTRAKQGLYLIAEPRESKSLTWNQLVFTALNAHPDSSDDPWSSQDSLKCHAQFGQLPDSLQTKQESEAMPPKQNSEDVSHIPLDLFEMESQNVNPFRHTPGSATQGLDKTQQFIQARQILSKQNVDARKRGTSIHSLLEVIDWMDSSEIWNHDLLSLWKKRGLDQIEDFDRLSQLILKNMSRLEVKEAFTKPGAQHVLCWREKAFECMKGTTWISGIMDRVVMTSSSPNPKPGEIISASIYDFKSSDNVPEYLFSKQLDTYRYALSKMIGLDESKIRTKIIQFS